MNSTSPRFFDPEAFRKIGSLGILAKQPPLPAVESKVKGGISKAAYDVISAREKTLKKWPSYSEYVPNELLATRIAKTARTTGGNHG